MTKLSNARVSWTVRNVVLGQVSARQAAKQLAVSKRRVLQLAAVFRDTGVVPKLEKARRPETFLSEEQKQWVDEEWERQRVGNRLLYFVLLSQGKPVPKNKLHAYLLESGRSKHDPRKQGKRKRCRYERDHSGSLLHSDWHGILTE